MAGNGPCIIRNLAEEKTFLRPGSDNSESNHLSVPYSHECEIFVKNSFLESALLPLQCRAPRLGLYVLWGKGDRQPSWLIEGRPLVLIGQTGVGKSFLAQSAGAQACHIGKTVLHFSVTEWLDERQEAHRTGQVLKFRKRMIKPDLLVLDDFGLKKFTAEESEDFRELLEERSFGKSLLLTTQLPFDHWSEVIPDPVLPEAIIDRLEGPALAIRITGESYRKYRGKTIVAGEEKTR